MPTAVGAISSSPSPGVGSGRSTSSSRSPPWNSIASHSDIEQPSSQLRTGDHGDGASEAIASRRDDDRRSARSARPHPRLQTWSRACVSWAGGSPLHRPRQAAAAPARSKIAGWNCWRATRPYGPRCSVSSMSRPRAREDVIWPLTSLLSSARWSGRSRPCRLARRASLKSETSPPSAASPGSPCTAWPSASSSARARRRGARAGAAVALGRGHVASICSARRPSPPPRPTATRSAATRRCGRWRTRRGTGRGNALLDTVPRVNLSVKVTALTARVNGEAPELGHRGRVAPAAQPAAHGQAGGCAPARRHGVDGLARADHRARHQAALRAGVP